jgi:hypothetical protein
VKPRFSVCALFYGDHPDLASRCLDGLLPSLAPAFVADLRLGANAPCPATLARLRDAGRGAAVPAYLFLPGPGPRNVGKYPLMRRMFYPPGDPGPLAPLTLWLDDDSYHAAPADWPALASAFDDPSVGAVGKAYVITPRGGQAAAVRAQPWYRGRGVGPRMPFATGGWWACRSDFLGRVDYPFPELHHNGGDVMLGQALHQAGLRVAPAPPWAVVNAAPRRGLDTPPLWADYAPGRRPSLAHHAFDCTPERLNP